MKRTAIALATMIGSIALAQHGSAHQPSQPGRGGPQNPLLQAFDAPDAQQCTGRRANTTVVPQALALLNDPFVRARAADFAARLLKESGEDPASCVEGAYPLAFSRSPTRRWIKDRINDSLTLLRLGDHLKVYATSASG